MNTFKLASLSILSLFMLFVGLGSWYTVDETQRGVILRNGALVGIAQPGLGFKLPWIDGLKKISVQNHRVKYSKMSAYSLDQQPAIVSLSVNFRIDPSRVADVYSLYQTESNLVERAISPQVAREFKTVFGQYTAFRSIQERAKLNIDTENALRAAVVSQPIIIESIQIENIDFSDAYEASIEQRMLAEVEVQKLKQNAEREKVQAQITVTKAQAEADAIYARAKAEADAIKLKGDAEATAIHVKGDALKSNTNLVQLIQAERWDGTLPTTMLPAQTLLIISMN